MRFPSARSAARIFSGLVSCFGFNMRRTTVSLTPRLLASSVFRMWRSRGARYRVLAALRLRRRGNLVAAGDAAGNRFGQTVGSLRQFLQVLDNAASLAEVNGAVAAGAAFGTPAIPQTPAPPVKPTRKCGLVITM